MTENVRAAVLGAIAGWTLGAQCRGRKGFRRLDFYDPIPPRMAQSSAIEAWLVSSAHLRSGGSPRLYSRELLDHWSYPIDETVFGLANLGRGVTSPVSGAFNNPLATASEAIGRAVYWGLALHGKPDEAAERAYYDASTDHDGDGTWVPVAIARTVALLELGKGPTDVLRDLTNSLPKQSRFRAAIPLVLKSVGNPDGAREARETVEGTLKLADPFHAAYTGAWVVLGLATGGGRFEQSVTTTAGCGGAAGHAALVCGAMSAFLEGHVPAAWTKHLGDAFVAGHGLRGIEPPKTIESFVKTVLDDHSQFAYVAPDPEPKEPSEEGAVAVVTLIATSPAMSERTAALLAKPQNETSLDIGPLTVALHYVESPVAYKGASLKLSLAFTNNGAEDLLLKPGIEQPQGWEIAHKVGEFVLIPGTTTSFALVVKPKSDPAPVETIKVSTPYGDASFPAFGPQLWYWVGPMTNQEGTGFDKEYPAEKNIKLGQVFNGRSNMPVEWRPLLVPGERIELEPLFGTGPGTVYLYCEAVLPKPGRYRLVAAAGVGVIAWIEGRKAFWYHHTHTPVPRATDPYVGSFETEGAVKVLLKTFRNLEPVPPMSVYFLAEDGTLAFPVGFKPLT
jgi:hypothetical protein